MRLLLAEDERALSRALVTILERNKYSVDAVYNGRDAFDYAVSGNYDGLILDIMMPGMDGVEVLRRLRAQGSDTPAIFLTAKSEIDDRIVGLDAGADDYLPKPFDMGELLARVRAMLRRKTSFQPDVLSFGGLELDRQAYTLSCGGKSMRLSGKEFQMLEMLMESPKMVISPNQFMEHIWGWNSDADISVVWVYVSNLRRKLTELGAGAEIRAKRGIGYSLEEKA
jgi:two-component system response regulator ArlR